MEPTLAKTLYVRPLTPTYTGDGSQVNDTSFTDTNTSDSGRMSSYLLACTGRGLSWVCGFGTIFKNGAFTSGTDLASPGGWLGDYSNTPYNSQVGAMRQLNIMLNFTKRHDWGRGLLVISDGLSMTDKVTRGHWGQLVQYLKNQDPALETTTIAELQAGALGWSAGKPLTFKPYNGILLLLSASTETMSDALGQDLADILIQGQSVCCLQSRDGQGFQNHNQVYNKLGVVTSGGALAVTTAAACSHAKTKFGNHVAWSTITKLHPSKTVTPSDGYTYRAIAGRPTLNSLQGQSGTWYPIKDYDLDFPNSEDLLIETTVHAKKECCLRIGDIYDVSADVALYPTKPDDWRALLADKTLSLDWTETRPNSVAGLQKCPIFMRVVGLGATEAAGPGFAIINGTRYPMSRGLTVFVISKSAGNALIKHATFDLHAGGEGSADGIANAAKMTAYLNALTSDVWVCIGSWDECKYNHLASGLPEAMARCGTSSKVWSSAYFQYRAAYFMLGTPGEGDGTAFFERYKGIEYSGEDSWFDIGIAFDDWLHPYVVGMDSDENEWYTHGPQSYIEDNRVAKFRYRKEMCDVDTAAIYGREWDVRYKDTRFHKLPMYENNKIVVSFENPCMILLNYPKPSINDVEVTEGDSGTVNVTFTITLDEAVEGYPLTMTCATKDGTARALSNETSVQWVATDPAGVPTMSYLDFDKTRVVFDAGFPKYYNSSFNVDMHNNIQKFTKNAMNWLNRGGRNKRILITGDSYPGSTSGTNYSIKGTGGADFGVALPAYLRSQGYTVDILGWTEMNGGAPSALIFDQYSVVIFFSSSWGSNANPPLGISFARSLENSIRRGTGCMVITDHADTAGSGFSASANAICNRFFANFSGSYDRTELDLDAMIAQGITHPLIHGMSGKMKAFGSEGRIDSTGVVGDPQDYVPKSETLTFEIGEISKTFTVQVCGDHLVEGDEYFSVVLSDISRVAEEPHYIKQEGRCNVKDDDGTPFGSDASSGGFGVEWKRQLYKNNTGVFILWSEHYRQPDRVDIFRDQAWLDSRPRDGRQAAYDYPSADVNNNLSSSGGQQEICIPHYAELGYTTFYDVRMQGSSNGTVWDYSTREELPRAMSGNHVLGRFAGHINMHDTRRGGRDTPFIIRVRYSGGGTVSIRRVGQIYVSGNGSGVYDMAHDPSRDFPYIEVALENATGSYTIEVV